MYFLKKHTFKDNDDCKLLVNGYDHDLRVKIKLINVPKILSPEWYDSDYNKIVKPFTDVNYSNEFLLRFSTDEPIEKIIKFIKIEGPSSTINLTYLKRDDLTRNNYICAVSVPKGSKYGIYKLILKFNGGSTKLLEFEIHEGNTYNTGIGFVALVFKNEKNEENSFDLSNSGVIRINNWYKGESFPEIRFTNLDNKGTQFLKLNIILYNENKQKIGHLSGGAIEVVVMDNSYSSIRLNPASFTFEGGQPKHLDEWFSFEIEINFIENKYLNPPRGPGSEVLLHTIAVLEGKKYLVQKSVTIPFSQTVFLLDKELRPAPYNLGINFFIKQRKKDNLFYEFAEVSYGGGFYITQRDKIFDDQSIQIGLIPFAGWEPYNNLKFAFGVGPNINIKFKHKANTAKIITLALVLNVGFAF